MKVGLSFVHMEPGESFGYTLYQVQYSIYDLAGSPIREGITEHEENQKPRLVIELPPGLYCVYASKNIDETSYYFGQDTFEVPTEIPPPSIQSPYPIGDVNFTVKMQITTDDMIEIPCSDMWPEPEPENSAGVSWIALMLLAIVIFGG